MVKGWRAGLLALTAMATTTAPAFAQRGEWGGRGGPGGGNGVERPGNPAGNPGGNSGAQPAPSRNWS
ncbi:MAG: hypothetical protein QM690_15420, partial [Sphingobium sp.]